MAGRAPDEEPSPGERLVKLSTNEAPFPPSPQVVAAVRDLEPERLRSYPTSTALAFRQAAAAHHGLDAANVITGNGSGEILSMLTRTFVPQGGRIASPWPTSPLYPTVCAIQGAEHVKVGWQEGYALPTAELLALRADAIYLANPNAPTGTFIPPAELGELAGRMKGVLLVDEAYVDFAEGNCVSLLAEHDNLVISRTLSFGYALAGLRFAYGLAHAGVVEQMVKVKDEYNVSALVEAAAIAALADQEHARRLWEHIRTERGRLTLELQIMGFEVPQSQANFVFARHPGHREAAVLQEGLRKQGVLVRSWTEPELADALGIGVGTSQENDALLGALEAVVGKSGGTKAAV
jgi:histidinol-phosphate aminotransferase